NAVYCGMTTALGRIAEAIGKLEDAQSFAKQASSLRQTLNERLWNDTSGTYVDGLDEEGRESGHSSLHSNTFMLAMGLVPDSRVESVVQFVRTRGLRCNLFLAMFLFEALFDYGASVHALELL